MLTVMNRSLHNSSQNRPRHTIFLFTPSIGTLQLFLADTAPSIPLLNSNYENYTRHIVNPRVTKQAYTLNTVLSAWGSHKLALNQVQNL